MIKLKSENELSLYNCSRRAMRLDPDENEIKGSQQGFWQHFYTVHFKKIIVGAFKYRSFISKDALFHLYFTLLL